MSTNSACLDSSQEYSFRVLGYLGSTPYYSDVFSGAIVDQSFYVADLAASASAFSVNAVWAAPESVRVVTEYVVWIMYAEKLNGFMSADDMTESLMTHELIPAGNTERIRLKASELSLEISGCLYDPSIDDLHCINPYTYYRVYVAPVDSANVLGSPRKIAVATSAASPVAPVALHFDSTSTTIHLDWSVPEFFGPITRTEIEVTNTQSGKQQVVMYVCAEAVHVRV